MVTVLTSGGNRKGGYPGSGLAIVQIWRNSLDGEKGVWGNRDRCCKMDA